MANKIDNWECDDFIEEGNWVGFEVAILESKIFETKSLFDDDGQGFEDGRVQHIRVGNVLEKSRHIVLKNERKTPRDFEDEDLLFSSLLGYMKSLPWLA